MQGFATAIKRDVLLPEAVVKVFDWIRDRSHPLHALRKHALFRFLSRYFDPMIAWRLPSLPRPIYLRLVSNASVMLASSAQEASVRETFTALLRGLPKNVPPVFWDVGANIGWFGWLCAMVRPESEIVSFEPDAKNVQCLERTSRAWNLPAHRVVPCAVAEQAGRAKFFLDELTKATGTLEKDQLFNVLHYEGRPRQIEVTTLSLDEFLAEKNNSPSIIKIDVEGAELRVLQGAFRVLREHRPLLFFETFAHRDEILSLLQGHGYMSWDSDRRGDVGDATINFVAVAPEHSSSAMKALQALGYPIDFAQ
jgi:FkbM family methyltransferase